MGDREQAFERHPKLAMWIEKLANRRIEGFSHASWCAFLSEINSALEAKALASRPDGWRDIESAPRGIPSEDVGCRGSSRWFLAGRPRQKTLTVRRRAWPQEDGWEDQLGNHYGPGAFTHWMPLPPAPEGPAE